VVLSSQSEVEYLGHHSESATTVEHGGCEEDSERGTHVEMFRVMGI